MILFVLFSKSRISQLLLFASLLCMLAICSCNQSTEKDRQKSANFDRILNESYKLGKPSKQLMKQADSAFNELDNPTIEEQCKRLEFKYSYFFDPKKPPVPYLDSIISIIEAHNLEGNLYKIYSNAMMGKADVLIKRNDYKDAFKLLHSSLKTIEAKSDTSLYVSFYGMMADIKYKEQDYLSAANYNKAAFKSLFNCDDDVLRVNYQQAILDNIGLCYDKYGMPDSAIYHYRQALDYIAKNGHIFSKKIDKEMSIALIYGNLGTTLHKIGKLKDAEQLFKKSIAINMQKGYLHGDAYLTMVKLGRLYLETARLKDAQKILQEANSKDDSTFPKFRIGLYKLNADYYGATNNLQLANKNLNAYILLHDSIELVNDKLRQADINKEFRLIEQEQSLSVLRTSSRNKTLYLGLSTVLLLAAVLITLMIFYNRKRLAQINVRVKAQNDGLKNTLNALKQSQEENTNIMKIVAHDLRTPMSITIGIVNILLDKIGLSASEKEMLEMMKMTNQNALEMTVDLLNINTSKNILKKGPVEIHTLLKECVFLLNIKASDKKQHIILKTQEAILNLNKDKIWRVINNLAINAIKFSPIGAEISIEMYKKEHSVCISIQDHGIGIPDELKNRIFDIFTDARRFGTSGEVSFGLGLSICKQIIEAHAGKISFISELNKGTTFLIELPI